VFHPCHRHRNQRRRPVLRRDGTGQILIIRFTAAVELRPLGDLVLKGQEPEILIDNGTTSLVLYRAANRSSDDSRPNANIGERVVVERHQVAMDRLAAELQEDFPKGSSESTRH
jgi:hypothetical protein